MPTSSGSYGRDRRPPARFPEAELPPLAAAAPRVSVPVTGAAPAETTLADQNPFGQGMAPLDLPTPLSEDPPENPMSRSITYPMKDVMARLRELEHGLDQAHQRLDDAERRLSLAEAVTTRFRETEQATLTALSRCAALEARLPVFAVPPVSSSYATQTAVADALDRGDPPGGQEMFSNLLRESVDPQGRHGKVRIGQRDKKRREKVEHSLKSSDSEFGSTSEEDCDPKAGSYPYKGPAVAGLTEIIPSRSDYKVLVSYRHYRLENQSQRYDKTVTSKLASLVKRLKHAIEDRFGGEEPIEVLAFLRTFKEAADHNDVGEGAAARLLPYFLKDAAKEGYRAHMDEAPLGMKLYPYMVQYLLATYALDDELARAYTTVTTARQAEGEDERSFARRLQRAAIRAGNVVNKTNLKTIYVEGLSPYVQTGLRMHLKPGHTFEEVQRLAHNMGLSLRQAMAQTPNSVVGVKPKYPPGLKTLLPRPVNVITETESGDTDNLMSGHISAEASLQEVEVALAQTQMEQGRRYPKTFGGSGQPSWQSTRRSPSPSVASIPTRGWTSPGGSVISEPVMRSHDPQGYSKPMYTGVARSALCFLCYQRGHMLAECPSLPGPLQATVRENRQVWEREQQTGGIRSPYAQGVGPSRSTSGSPGPATQDSRRTATAFADVNAVQASGEEELSPERVNGTAEAGNEQGGQ
jgi:hypothetical protein